MVLGILCMTKLDSANGNRGIYFVLWMLCILGAWSVLPYLLHLNVVPPSVSWTKLFLLLTGQSMLLFGLVCWLSSWLVPKTDLRPFASGQPFAKVILPGVIAGVLVGASIYLLNVSLFKSSVLAGVHPPAWTGLLASLYGAINEEVLLRLFLFTTVYFLIGNVVGCSSQNRLWLLWIANVIVAVVFGLGHLPAALKLAPLSSLEVSRVLLLNGIPGVVFGWLYWSRGLWSAVTAHFVTDLVFHVLFI